LAKKKISKKTVHSKNKVTKSKVTTKNLKVKTKKSKFAKIVLPIIGILIIAVAVFLLLKGKNDTASDELPEIVAYVNDQAIYATELQEQYASLSPEIKQSMNENSLLTQMIDEHLLLSKAEELGIVVTEEEIEASINNILVQNNLDMNQLIQNLEIQGLTLEALKELFEKQIMINKLLTEEIFVGIEVSDEEVNQYYEENLELFKTDEQVKARHILIQFGDKSEEEVLSEINAVKERIDAGEDFCDLVTELSEDPGSLETCGEYTFQKGVMVPEFEAAAFGQEPNEMRIVKTSFGYHLIETLELIEPSMTPIADVKENIQLYLEFEKQKAQFTSYVQSLKAENKVLNCLEEPKECPKKKTVKKDTNKEEITTIETALETSPVEVSTGTTTNIVAKIENGPDSFAKCLTKNNFKMYGAYWCSYCAAQKELFGNSFQYITYVECAEEDNPREQTIACQNAGISGYPTLEINGVKYPGGQTLEKISELSGCEL